MVDRPTMTVYENYGIRHTVLGPPCQRQRVISSTEADENLAVTSTFELQEGKDDAECRDAKFPCISGQHKWRQVFS